MFLRLILFHVSSLASSRLCRDYIIHAHVASQLLTRYQTASIKQESSEEKPARKKDKYFIFSLVIMTEDSATLSLDLANDFPEAEEIQTRNKEPTPKNIQAEDRQSNNEMMEILKYMKSEIASLKRKQEALEFANPPRLRKFPRLPDLTNNDMESELLTSEHTSRVETSPEKQSHI